MTNKKTLIENLCMDKELKQPKRHTAAGEGVVRTDEKGVLVLLSDYEKLLRYTAILDRHEEVQYKQREAFEKLANELKAEVERLTALVESNLNQSKRAMANSDAYVRSLEAQVERLTKAGDVMISEWASGNEKDAKNFLKALVIWNAAKEGKGQP